MELFDLAVGELKQDLSVRAFRADDIEHAETYVVDAVLAVHHRRNGHGRVDAREQRLYDMADRGRDGIEGSALALDNARARFADIGFDFVVVEIGVNILGVYESVAFGERNI